MAHGSRKTQRLRGSRTHGYGNAQKHRGAGSRGGRGMAGSKKQKWSYVSKFLPGYFGHRGFKRPPSTVKEVRTINLADIEKNLESLVAGKHAELKDAKYVLDLTAMGYDKLLGSGKVSHAMVIKVDSCSQLAAKKVQEAGGKIEAASE
jgi:large subunit ribosomal protein L15